MQQPVSSINSQPRQFSGASASATQPNPYSFASPTASSSFVPAPAPVLLDDGDITVVSALTTTTARPNPLYNVQSSLGPSPGGAPTTSMVLSPPPTTIMENPPGPPTTIVEKSPGPPRTIATATSTSTSNQEPSTAIVPAEPLTKMTSPTSTALTQSAPATLMATKTTTTTMTTYKAGAVRGPHKTYPPEVEKMKVRRKRATIAAGVTGGIVGLIALGPVGAVVGGAGATLATRTVGKRKERKKREEIAQKKIAEAERDAPDVLVHAGSGLL